MRLENFLALTQTKLINDPCISSFENIVFEAAKVKRGDLFFAYNYDDIELAVQNGAYCIVFDRPTEAKDGEIAWIYAKSLDYALKRLLRFRVIEKEVTAYECNEIVLKLSMQIQTQPNFITLYGDLKSLFKTLWDVESRSIVLFSPTISDREIFTAVKKIPDTPNDTIEIMEQTLFETSFVYDNIFYERQLISPFFIPYLEELLYLYKSLKISYKLKKFTPIEHFEPVFTNKKFEIKSFGTSDKVLIFEPNMDLIESQILFLRRHASWANMIFVVPLSAKIEENERDIFTYKNDKDIIGILKNNNFNFALIVGVDKSILSKPLSNQMQLTMDFSF